jgi:nucleotide-binding universal stress UspA family protein
MKPLSHKTEPRSAGFSIVVGLAFTDADGPAFDRAAVIAKRIPQTALHLVHVFDRELSAERSKELVGHLRLYANEKAASTSGLAGITVGIHLRAGKTVREIVQLATEVSADLIVLGSSRGPHLKHWIVGSTAERLIAEAPCPVLVASPRPKESPRHEPEIEPPCPDFLQARAASRGLRWWCERHSHSANMGHSYSYQQELPFASHDSEVIPTGIAFK